jgi:hypothetical protein
LFLQTQYFVVVHLVYETMKRRPYFQLRFVKDLVNTDFDHISGLSIPNFIDKHNQTIYYDGVTLWN